MGGNITPYNYYKSFEVEKFCGRRNEVLFTV